MKKQTYVLIWWNKEGIQTKFADSIDELKDYAYGELSFGDQAGAEIALVVEECVVGVRWKK